MSGVLRSKKKIAVLISFIVACLCVVMLGVCLKLGLVFYIVVYFLMFSVAALTFAVWRKMKGMSAPFGTFSNIRNVDYLIIGDFCNAEDYVPKGSSFVQVAAPGRGLNSSYQILRHTHSILKENGGNVVIVLGKSKKEFTIFDMPFLHPITIKKYHLELLKMKSKLTFIFAPLDSVRFLLGSVSKYSLVQSADAELASFCAERGYSLTCIEKI